MNANLRRAFDPLDWRPVLKPLIRSSWDFSFLNETSNDPDDVLNALPREAPEEAPNETISQVIPRKRAQADIQYLSPQRSLESFNMDEVEIADEVSLSISLSAA